MVAMSWRGFAFDRGERCDEYGESLVTEGTLCLVMAR